VALDFTHQNVVFRAIPRPNSTRAGFQFSASRPALSAAPLCAGMLTMTSNEFEEVKPDLERLTCPIGNVNI
jgi:hypothetical protein